MSTATNVIALTRSRSYRSSRRLSAWRHGLQAADVAAAAVDDDRWKTGPAVVAVDRATALSAPSTIATAGSCARSAAGSSDLTPKGSTRLSSNWIFMVADCSAGWRRAEPEWNSGHAGRHREAWGLALIAAPAAVALLLKDVKCRCPVRRHSPWIAIQKTSSSDSDAIDAQ